MGMSLVIALMSSEEDVWKVPKIQIAAFCCILLSFLMRYDREALL